MPEDSRRLGAKAGIDPPSLLKNFRGAALGMKLLLALYWLQMLLGLAAGFAAPWIGRTF
jgi:hypothetical protein